MELQFRRAATSIAVCINGFFCNDETSTEECGKEQFLHLHRALSARGPEAGTVTPSRRADLSSTQSPFQHRYRSDNLDEELLHEDAADQRCVSCYLELARRRDFEFRIECRKVQFWDSLNELLREEADVVLVGSRLAR